MARVKDSYYFETFVECADYSLQAAKLLKEIMTDYDSTMIGENTKKFILLNIKVIKLNIILLKY